MDAGMAALRQQQAEQTALPSPLSPRASRPPPARGDRPGPPRAPERALAPAQPGNIAQFMLTPEDRQPIQHGPLPGPPPAAFTPHPQNYPGMPFVPAPVPTATQRILYAVSLNPGGATDLSRKPSLTVSSQAAAQARPNPDRSGSDASYRAHDSPMPFHSFGARSATYPHQSPANSPLIGGTFSGGSAETLAPLPSIDVVGAHGSSNEKIWVDEVQAYSDMDDEEEAEAKKKRKKMLIWGLLAIVLIAAIAAAVGVTVSKNANKGKADEARLQASGLPSGSSSAAHNSSSPSPGAESEVLQTASLSAQTTHAARTTAAVEMSTTSTASLPSTASSSTLSNPSSAVSSEALPTPSRIVTSTRSSTPTLVASSSTQPTSRSASSPTSGQVVTRPVPVDSSAIESSTAPTRTPVSGGEGKDDDDDSDSDDTDDEPGFNPFDPSTWKGVWSSHRNGRRSALH
ncbi:hypothetical protein JCM10213v2_000662 [Rhodosporidiobolus nylandii]